MNNYDNYFKLEQSILGCWHIVDDLSELLKSDLMDSNDPVSKQKQLNILIGLKELYQLKFDTLFNDFEKLNDPPVVSTTDNHSDVWPFDSIE